MNQLAVIALAIKEGCGVRKSRTARPDVHAELNGRCCATLPVREYPSMTFKPCGQKIMNMQNNVW